MRNVLAGLALVCTLMSPALAHSDSNAFLGRWDFDIKTPTGMHANWLGVTEKNGALEIWFQPIGGHVYQVKDYHLEDSHLSLALAPASGTHPAMRWDLNAKGGELIGVQKRGNESIQLMGVRAPELKRSMPKAWTNPEPLFNGKDLDGWEPVDDIAKNNWVVNDGLLVNEARGANLKSKREFNDFRAHFEVNCPEGANSGFYLRGRYEVQLEYEPVNSEPVERQMGSIYGRIAPSAELPRTPGKWETFDVTLVGRTVTVVRNGVKIIDAKEIEGITGGALDADEGKPGPFYLQGDHTGGLKFRNVTVSVPRT